MKKGKKGLCKGCWHSDMVYEWCDACAMYNGSEFQPKFFKALFERLRFRLRQWWYFRTH